MLSTDKIKLENSQWTQMDIFYYLYERYAQHFEIGFHASNLSD